MFSAKHLVSKKGCTVHAWQHRLIGFLKFCRLLLNMIYGYSLSSGCVVCFGVLSIGCVSSKWIVSSIGLSLARISFCFREGLFLYAIMGVLER